MKKNSFYPLLGSIALSVISSNSYSAERHSISRLELKGEQIKKSRQAQSSELLSKLNLSARYALETQAVATDKANTLHTKMRQSYKGIPVWGQTLMQHQGTQGHFVNGHYATGIEKDLPLDSDILAAISQQDAIAKVLAQRAKTPSDGVIHSWTMEKSEATLIIYLGQQFSKAKLAYHVDLLAISDSGDVSRPQAIVDAITGQILDSWDSLASAEATGPGGNVKTGKYHYGTEYAALSVTQSGSSCSLENENVKAVDLEHSYSEAKSDAFSFNCAENNHKEINGAYSPINDAYYFGNLAFNMYRDWYGINPLPFQLSMKVHYGNGVDNAYWTGTSMLFGDGFSKYYPLVDVNVSIHEVSHGFTEFNSNLEYRSESGGINEAFSDIAGEAAEYYWKGEVDWIVGQDVHKAHGGLRYFDDPTRDGVSIAQYSNYYEGLNVHYSSGLFNRAYYLIATQSGWDPHKAFDIFVQANRFYWTENTTFAEGACGVINSAKDLDYDQSQVFEAFASVGLICSTIDSDEDGITDANEILHGFNPADETDAVLDFDLDGLTNKDEINLYQTNPKLLDTDGDTLSDSIELHMGTSALNQDTDGDQMPDAWEQQYGLEPLTNDALLDKDNDMSVNLAEYQAGTNPISSLDKPVLRQYQTNTNWTDYTPGWDRTQNGDGWELVSQTIRDNETARASVEFYAEDGQFSLSAKVSSEANFDFLNVELNGTNILSLSGEQDWSSYTFDLTKGTHVLDIYYSKDGSVDNGEDKAWISNLKVSSQTNQDSDNNGLDDYWERYYGIHLEGNAAIQDSDGDGLTNLQEYQAYTHPLLSDTDADGISDFDEINLYQTSAHLEDSDNDGMTDLQEVTFGFLPTVDDANSDADNDGWSNRIELTYASDPTDALSLPAGHDYLVIDFNDESSVDLFVTPNTSDSAWYLETSTEQTHYRSGAIGNSMLSNTELKGFFAQGELTLTLSGNIDTPDDKFVLSHNDTHYDLSNLTSFTLALDEGEHSFVFSYQKGSSGSSSEDKTVLESFSFVAPHADTDGDGLTNQQELAAGTSLTLTDTDGDGLTDGDEVNTHKTNPLQSDTDSDGLSDGEEVNTYSTDPNRADTDGDGVSDGDEVKNNTSPTNSDTDGDGVPDGEDKDPLNKPSSGGSLGLGLLTGLLLVRRRRS